MKKILVSLFMIIALVACREKVYTDADEPEWLKLRIASDEQMIRSNPQSGLDAAAWLRFEWESSYYYDYVNLNNSGGPETYTYEGQKISFSADQLAAYKAERCCEHVVWRGAKYQ